MARPHFGFLSGFVFGSGLMCNIVATASLNFSGRRLSFFSSAFSPITCDSSSDSMKLKPDHFLFPISRIREKQNYFERASSQTRGASPKKHATSPILARNQRRLRLEIIRIPLRKCLLRLIHDLIIVFAICVLAYRLSESVSKHVPSLAIVGLFLDIVR
jgi:hypothetical protein